MRGTNLNDSSPRRTIIFVLCAIALMICTFSCDSQLGGSSARTGKLKLSLKADTTSLKKEGSSNLTKALSDELAPFQTVDDYKIDILQDEKSIKTFDRFDEMPSEIELPEGTYTLVASKGDDKPAAFENPFFEGSTSFTVKEGMSTPLDVTCTLANARVTVEYTEEFKDTYSTYTVLLKTPFTLEDKLEISQKESRPAYMQVAPDGTDLATAIRLKKKGEETEKTYPVPNSLKMERRQNIHLIFKPGKETDGLGLDIWLDDELIERTLYTDIPDYMWKPFALPELFPENFPEDELFEVAAGDIEGINPIVGFVAPAGIGAFHISQWTEGIVGDTIYYNIATPEGAQAAKDAGFDWNIKDIDCLKDVRKPGQLTISGAIANLQGSEEGETYGFGFYANDALPKTNYTERLTFKVRVKPAGAPTLNFPAFPLAIVEGDDMSNDCIVLIKAATGIDPEKTVLTITGKDNNTQKYKIKESVDELRALGIEAEITNIQYKLTFLKAFSSKLEVPDSKSEQAYTYKVEMKELGVLERELNTERSFTVKAPVFAFTTTEGDAFAKRVVLRTDMQIGNMDKLKFRYKTTTSGEWSDVVSAGMEKEGISYVDTLKSLTPNTEYQIQAVYNGKRYSTEIATVHTESIGVLPNAGFEQWSIAADQNGSTSEGAKNSLAGAGGLFGTPDSPGRYWEVWQPWSDNQGWNTLNLRTTSEGRLFTSMTDSERRWTRYVANSGTIKTEGKEGNGALIRTVGWGLGNSANVAEGKPGTIKNITQGELYLGGYNQSNHTPKYGIEFATRPSGISFDSKYIRKGTDTFIAEIVILSNNDEVIASSQLPASLSGETTTWKNRTIKLDYKGTKKATKIYILFKSGISSSEDDIMIYPPASDLSVGEYVGSQLYIDNVELIYE